MTMKKNLLSKTLYLFVTAGLLLFTAVCPKNTKAQMVYLADTNFKNALIAKGFGPCITGDSIDASCPAVVNATYFDFYNNGILNLQGIQVFTNLKHLDCSKNKLSTLPSLPNS